MDDLFDFFQAISIENSWPVYLLLYGFGLVVTIVAIRKNKKKSATKVKQEEQDLDDLLK